ncbi:hypothetical protein QYE76_070433 [Lolium multiflorum]|uniref:Uncharacterized protein n=1 Tax=Lolium multiflorum TaxID=4521 RepID=A0AAD8SJC5_LOLMU|nr:hypothetical protein QYE76_070433 [Lolium multiflorum]
MMKIKRKDVPSRTTSRNLRSSGRFIDDEGVLSQELAAKLSPSIVWLASFVGEEPHSVCTGIVVRNDPLGASFVTSGDLVTSREFVTTQNSGSIDKLKIKVHLPNGKMVNASVQDYNVACNMIVVTTKSFPDLRPACLDKQMQVEHSTLLLAASLCPMSDKFSVKTGVLTNSPIGVESHGIMWSTCEITEVGKGGPLVDFDGNIVGMNLCTRAGATQFVPKQLIVECMCDLGFWIYVNNVPTPFDFSSEGTSNLDTIISSSQSGSSKGSENENQEPCAFANHGANGIWCDLNEELASKLSPSIISLASFDEEGLHSECTGMVIDRKLSSASFLTTGGLFEPLHQDLWHGLTIKVRLPNNEVIPGRLQYYSAPSSLVVIITDSLPPSLDLRVACLGNDMQVEPSAELSAVSRCFDSGKLMSTRAIIEAVSGGPLVDCDGNIVGINYCEWEDNLFLPSNRIFECLGSDVNWAASKQDCCRTNKMHKSSTPHSDGPEELTDDELRRILPPWRPDGFTERVNAILDAFGYPLPSFADVGMHLKWDFEEGFGADVRSEPIRRVTSKMSRSVVALASFLRVPTNDGSGNYKKGARKFACTGVFIECDESTTRILTSASLVRGFGDGTIQHEWKIEVCLPNKQREEGTLQYYNLQYNVAVVSIKRSAYSYSTAKLDETSQTEVGAQVVALGRGFESGKFMATHGAVTGKRRRFGDATLQISTCKTTKVGIGGPLVDFDGNFVGMNFYDTEQTPYLSRVRILELMAGFNAEWTAPVETPDKFPSWHVPDPEWFYPTRYPAKRRIAKLMLE